MPKPQLLKSIMIQNNCPNPKLFAAIDVGSNTIRLLVGSVEEDKVIRVYKSRAVTRLGKGIFQNSLLNKENIDKSVDYLIEIQHKCDNLNVNGIIAVGTSALREAKNSRDFLELVKLKTNIDIKVITGKREAELTLKGVMSNFYSKGISLTTCENFLIADIGGGSTEWVVFNAIKTEGSLPIGAVKAYDRFIIKDPPSQQEIQSLKNFINQQITDSDLMKNLKSNLYSNDFDFIVTGGTAATVAAIDLGLGDYDGDKIHLHRIPRPTLQLLFNKLIAIPLSQRQLIRGVEPDRADIIITGALILLCLMEIFKINELVVSDFGLLEGLIYERNQSLIYSENLDSDVGLDRNKL